MAQLTSMAQVDDKKVRGEVKASSYICPITGEVFTNGEDFKRHLAKFKKIEENETVVKLQLQPYTSITPQQKETFHQTSTAADDITIKTWWDEWLKNKIHNMKTYDPLKHNVMLDYGKLAYKPCIIAGSGPSLKKNAHLLKERHEIGLVSTLHNFGYFEELGVQADYYLNLDAGDITIPEASEGFTDIYEKTKGLSIANKTAYLDKCKFWDRTKGKTLVTALHTNPELIKRWQGRILWFDTALSGMNQAVSVECPEIMDFRVIYQTGGNTLGSCLYHARAILGATPIAFVGADFCFQDKKFHAWDSPYDSQYSGLMPCVDIYGMKQFSWQSYLGFKSWFEFQAMGGQGNAPQTFINCTEGGCLGAHPEGNMIQIKQRTLKAFLAEYNLYRALPDVLKDKTKYTALF